MRSSAKPFQALPFIEMGGDQNFGLSPREVALMCASHSGTDEHVETIKGMQRIRATVQSTGKKIKGLGERSLEIGAIIDGQVGRLVITHKDRLLRFGAELVFAICEAKGVEVVILNQGEDTTFEEDLAKDVLEIITVFSARLYGSRSRKNQKLLDGVKAAVEASQC